MTRARRASRIAARLAVASVALLPFGGCELDEATVPTSKPQVVVHAVLNPIVTDQLVLVEQTLTGEVVVPDRVANDSLDPILSGGGVPITDAEVKIHAVDDAGFAVGIQDAAVRPDGKGKGVYRFRNLPIPTFLPRTNQVPLVREKRYELVITWRGQVTRAFTTVPNPDRLVPIDFARATFNVDHDSLVFDWPRAAAAKRYALLAQTPFGPFLLFSDSARLVVRGGLRNLFAEGFPYAFQPGFRQTIATEAVDTNYFDYYRSFNNPFTGTGIVNHVDGGIGVFGSIYPLDTLGLDVVADFDESFEGHYVGGPSGTDQIDLYLGEPVGDGARRVSGQIRRGTGRNGIVGTTTDGRTLSLVVLHGQFANDSLALFPVVAAGDSIVGAIGGEPSSVWRRTSIVQTTGARSARTPRAAPAERRYALPQRSPPRWHSAQTP